MLMPTKDRQQIYEYIFEEGVMVAKKGEIFFGRRFAIEQ